MISYDRRRWWPILFAVRGTVLPRVYRRLLFYTALTAGLWALHGYINKLPNIDSLGHALVGVAMGLMIVFRTNSSYDRFWEGRKLWGNLVTAARNLVRGEAAYRGKAAGLANLATAYALALKQRLRGSRDLSEIKGLVSPEVYEQVVASPNPPSTLAYYLSLWIQQAQAAKELDGPVARSLEGCVCTMVECEGGCERIVRTPIPLEYAAHIKQLLMLYLLTLPFILVPKMDWAAIPAVAGITFGLLGIEEAGVAIEDPFGDDPNDLPLEELCGQIAEDGEALERLAAPADPQAGKPPGAGAA
jgi:putative membrane protein